MEIVIHSWRHEMIMFDFTCSFYLHMFSRYFKWTLKICLIIKLPGEGVNDHLRWLGWWWVMLLSVCHNQGSLLTIWLISCYISRLFFWWRVSYIFNSLRAPIAATPLLCPAKSYPGQVHSNPAAVCFEETLTASSSQTKFGAYVPKTIAHAYTLLRTQYCRIAPLRSFSVFERFFYQHKQSAMAQAASIYPPLKDRPIKNTICLFDVDGTLTPARRVRKRSHSPRLAKSPFALTNHRMCPPRCSSSSLSSATKSPSAS